MATADAIASFRLLIAESADEEPYTDAALGDRLDAATTPEGLAANVWTEKAANYAALVSVSESGSSRQMSDLHKNALAMAAHFRLLDSAAPGTGVAVRGTRMSRLTR